MTRWAVMVTTVFGLSATSHAEAQQWMLGGHGAVATGLEGGDPGRGETTFRRARTRLSAGLDLRVDEAPKDGFGLVVFTELEPHVSVGGELRYLRWFGPSVVGFVGATGTFAPRTLLGADFGIQFHVGEFSGGSFFLEPSFSALPLGTDLPSDRVLFWGLLSGGIHATL